MVDSYPCWGQSSMESKIRSTNCRWAVQAVGTVFARQLVFLRPGILTSGATGNYCVRSQICMQATQSAHADVRWREQCKLWLCCWLQVSGSCLAKKYTTDLGCHFNHRSNLANHVRSPTTRRALLDLTWPARNRRFKVNTPFYSLLTSRTKCVKESPSMEHISARI